MKKILVLFSMAAISLSSHSQNCEEREANLLNTLGGMSAGFLYNTYVSIGSLSDGYAKDVYSKDLINSLVEEQTQLIENVRIMLNDLLVKKSLISDDDQKFVKQTMEIMNGLKEQARFLKEIANTNETAKKDAYQKQRQDNWKKISKLMGLDNDNAN